MRRMGDIRRELRDDMCGKRGRHCSRKENDAREGSSADKRRHHCEGVVGETGRSSTMTGAAFLDPSLRPGRIQQPRSDNLNGARHCPPKCTSKSCPRLLLNVLIEHFPCGSDSQ